MDAAEKLATARCRLLTRSPFYAHVAMSMTWTPSQMEWTPEPRRTMGVRIVNGGEVQCIYYPPFVETLTIKELYGVIQHEIEHIVRLHCLRVSSRLPEAWNIAADMCVNGQRRKPRVGYEETTNGEMVLPFKGNLVWIPDDWPAEESSENYYDRLEKRQNGPACPNCGRPVGKGKQGQGQGSGKGKGKDKSQGQGGGGEGEGQGEGGEGGGGCGHGEGEHSHGGGGSSCGCPSCGQEFESEYNYGGVSGHMVDDHSVWNQSDVSQDEARQIVKDIVDQAASKSQGRVPGHLAEAIKALGKPIVRWRELLRQYIGRHVGNRRYTWSRRNRRRDEFGVKGVSHHAAADVNVIIDTSGSVGTKEMEQFFAEIDTIAARAKVHILQWDHAFQGWGQYRRGMWKNFKVCGRGGTDMSAPIQYLMDKGLIADVQIMLTDGYCNWHQPEPFPMITVITSPEGTVDGPKWGHEVRLKVKE